jgi:4'-phosphopantetheinyl transferase
MGYNLTQSKRLLHYPIPKLALPDDEVHVWCISLEQPVSYVQQFGPVLSQGEWSRAERFYFERDQRRFIVTRGMLRIILGQYLAAQPDQIQFRYGSYGKPYLSETFGRLLQFNLAHSHELAVYAFTCGREVGIDLEFIRPMPDAERIAAAFFLPQEIRIWQRLPQHQRLKAFFNGWTRKEAYLKAIGAGLAQPLDQIEVSIEPGKPAHLLSIKGCREEAARWSLESLSPAPDYVAALAVEGDITEKLEIPSHETNPLKISYDIHTNFELIL